MDPTVYESLESCLFWPTAVDLILLEQMEPFFEQFLGNEVIGL